MSGPPSLRPEIGRPAMLSLPHLGRLVGLLLPLVLVPVLAACSSSGQATPAATTPLPAGRFPSAVSKMVCKNEAAHTVGLALGETASLSTPTWVGHLYTCQYNYSSGTLTLTVKELSSWPETLAYFHGLGDQLGVARTLPNLGQGAFQTSDGSVVVRKDWKVLLVDPTHLPAQFGNPPTTSGDIAYTVASLVLGCWAGD